MANTTKIFRTVMALGVSALFLIPSADAFARRERVRDRGQQKSQWKGKSKRSVHKRKQNRQRKRVRKGNRKKYTKRNHWKRNNWKRNHWKKRNRRHARQWKRNRHYRTNRWKRPRRRHVRRYSHRPYFPLGLFVRYISPDHRWFISGGVTYYQHDDVYYRRVPNGYVVVEKPETNIYIDQTPVVSAPMEEKVVDPYPDFPTQLAQDEDMAN